MTKDETIKLIGIVTMAYPNFDKFRDEKHIRSLVALWGDMFADDDAGLVGLAVKKHISTSKWPPSIAEIREILVDIMNPELLPPEAAWDIVSKLIFAVGEFCHEDIRPMLPRPVADTVEAIGYTNLRKMNTNGSGLARLAFTQSYKERIDRMRKEALLPETLREQVQIAGKAFDNGTYALIEAIDKKYVDKKDTYASLKVNLLDSFPELEAAHPARFPVEKGKEESYEPQD